MNVASICDAVHLVARDEFGSRIPLPLTIDASPQLAPTTDNVDGADDDDSSAAVDAAAPVQDPSETFHTKPSAADAAFDGACALLDVLTFVAQTPYFVYAHAALRRPLGGGGGARGTGSAESSEASHWHRLLFLLEDCRSARFLDALLPCLLACAHHHTDSFFAFLHAPARAGDGGDFRSLMGALRAPTERTRLCAMRLIGYYLCCDELATAARTAAVADEMHPQWEVNDDADADPSAVGADADNCHELAQNLAVALVRVLGAFPFTRATYQTLLQLAIGAPSLELDDDVVLDDTKILRFPNFLGTAFELLHATAVDFRANEPTQSWDADRNESSREMTYPPESLAERAEQWRSQWLAHLQLQQAVVLDLLTLLHLHTQNPTALVTVPSPPPLSPTDSIAPPLTATNRSLDAARALPPGTWQRWLTPLTECASTIASNPSVMSSQAAAAAVLAELSIASPVHSAGGAGTGAYSSFFQSPHSAASLLVYGGSAETATPISASDTSLSSGSTSSAPNLAQQAHDVSALAASMALVLPPPTLTACASATERKGKTVPTIEEGIITLHEIINQQVSSVCSVLLYHALRREHQGWQAIDQLSWHLSFHHNQAHARVAGSSDYGASAAASSDSLFGGTVNNAKPSPLPMITNPGTAAKLVHRLSAITSSGGSKGVVFDLTSTALLVPPQQQRQQTQQQSAYSSKNTLFQLETSVYLAVLTKSLRGTHFFALSYLKYISASFLSLLQLWLFSPPHALHCTSRSPQTRRRRLIIGWQICHTCCNFWSGTFSCTQSHAFHQLARNRCH